MGLTGSPFDDALVEKYRELRVLDERQHPVHLPSGCPRATSCWRGVAAAHVPQPKDLASQLSPPWVGSRYDTGRTLILLENLREYGGFDLGAVAPPVHGMRFLGEAARWAFGKGERRLFGNAHAGKTAVWWMAASYAAAWCEAAEVCPVRWDAHHRVASLSLAEVMEFVAIVQHVKCSPLRGRGEQSPAMWRNCGEHLLVPEMEVLRPSRIIVLGTSDNAFALRNWVLPVATGTARKRTVAGKRRRTVTLETRSASYGEVSILSVPHPAAPGGTARALLGEARELLLSHDRRTVG